MTFQTFHLIAFVLCSLAAVGGALGVVLERRAFYSGLALALSILAVAGLFALLGATFLAALQVLIYVGAVAVIFLFVVGFLGVYTEAERGLRRRYLLVGAATTAAALGFILLQVWRALREAAPAVAPGVAGDARAFAEALFERFALPLELTSLFFLIALVAAVYLTRGRRVP
ncbi:NADH-quinone oxidoreductase subunit J [bacterium HR11]|nr:NADH-quinone oxidoreductase subunit J [bacterium HR11]